MLYQNKILWRAFLDFPGIGGDVSGAELFAKGSTTGTRGGVFIAIMPLHTRIWRLITSYPGVLVGGLSSRMVCALVVPAIAGKANVSGEPLFLW